MLRCLSYSNDNTCQSSLLSLSTFFFLALCFLISCPGAFIIGHLSSVQVVDWGRGRGGTNWHAATTLLTTPTNGYDRLAHSIELERRTPFYHLNFLQKTARRYDVIKLGDKGQAIRATPFPLNLRAQKWCHRLSAGFVISAHKVWGEKQQQQNTVNTKKPWERIKNVSSRKKKGIKSNWHKKDASETTRHQKVTTQSQQNA